MTAAAVIGQLAATGARQLLASFPAALGIALVIVVPCGTAAGWRLLRAERRFIMPDDELDVPDWVRPSPVVTCHDRAAADAVQREIDDLIERYGNG